jgi:hypothetical protein
VGAGAAVTAHGIVKFKQAKNRLKKGKTGGRGGSGGYREAAPDAEVTHQMQSGSRTIAGKGGNNSIRDIDQLIKRHPEFSQRSEWSYKSTEVFESDQGIFEKHYYEYKGMVVEGETKIVWSNQ